MSKNILVAKIRKELNKQLPNNYFPEIPLEKIFNTLLQNNITALQEDGTKWTGFLCGEKGRAVFDLGNIFTKNDQDQYEKYDNVQLILTWYKIQSGNFEIVTYIS